MLEFKEVLVVPRGKGPNEGYQFTAMIKYDGHYYLFEDLLRKFLIYTEDFEFVDTLLMEKAVPVGVLIEHRGEILAFESTYESLKVYRLDLTGTQASLDCLYSIRNKYSTKKVGLRGVTRHFENEKILYLESGVTMFVFKKTPKGVEFYDQFEIPREVKNRKSIIPHTYYASEKEIVLKVNHPSEWYRYDVSKKKMKKVRAPKYEIGFKFTIFGKKYHAYRDGVKHFVEEL